MNVFSLLPLLLSLILLYAPVVEISAQAVTVNAAGYGDTSVRDYFGMRLRAAPAKIDRIQAPVIVHPSPGNEASIVKLQGDSLRIYYINTPEEPHIMKSILSTDGGFSWGTPVREFELPGKSNYGQEFLIDNMGNYHSIFHIYSSKDTFTRSRFLDIWHSTRKPGDTEWKPAKMIFHGWVGALRNLMQLKSGRILAAFAKAIPERQGKPMAGEKDWGRNEVIAVYSDDGGENWLESKSSLKIEVDPTMTSRYGAIEPSVIELKDGRLWMLIRTNKGHLYESFSADGGMTWQEPVRSRFISSDSPSALLRLASGELLLLFNSCQRWDDRTSYAAGGREMLHAAISSDDGKSWSGFREILSVPPGLITARGDRGSAYPSVVENKKGKLVLVSGQGAAKSIAIMDPDWLRNKIAHDDFSKGLEQWTFYGGDKLFELKKVDAKKNALRVSSPAVGGKRPEAVWNFPALANGVLQMRVKLEKNVRGITLALTDHFSVSADTAASQKAIVRFTIDQHRHPSLFAASSIDVRITWNRESESANLYCNGKMLETRQWSRVPAFGVNYLRVGLPAETTAGAGFTIHEVKTEESR